MSIRPPSTPGSSGRPQIILIVDDSAVCRQTLKAVVEADPAFRTLTACDPFDAAAVMKQTAPDAILLDVDMPRMDGLTFLKKLMRQHPLPVVLCTDFPERGVAALEFGARDVVPKPNWDLVDDLELWSTKLRESLYMALGITPASKGESLSSTEARLGADVILPRNPYVALGAPAEKLIAIGASTGGVQAVMTILAGLPANMPGIVIVLHMPAGFTGAFADRLNRVPSMALHVVEAHPGDPIRPGVALVVPGTAHGVVRRVGRGYRLDLDQGPLVNRFRPSVDVLFRSVAQAAGPRSAGIILTGMLQDGAQGLLEISEADGWTIAQDEASSTVFGMNKEAIRLGAARQVLPLDRIGRALEEWAMRPNSRE